MNRSTTLSDRVWNWLAYKALPDSALVNLCREDFDAEAFGETRVEWPAEHERETPAPATKTQLAA